LANRPVIVLREMQIRNPVSCHYISTKQQNLKSLIVQCEGGCDVGETPLEEGKLVQPHWKK
jgi:hypothetical protein